MPRIHLFPRLAAILLSALLIVPVFAEDAAKPPATVDTPLPGDTPAAADSGGTRHAASSARPHTTNKHGKASRHAGRSAVVSKHGKARHATHSASKGHKAGKAKSAAHARKPLKKRR